MINSNTIIDYSDMDYEIRDLVKMINKVDGIETLESCSGHEHYKCEIYCQARSIADLNKFIRKYFYRDPLWHIEIFITDKQIDERRWDDIYFLLYSDMRYPYYPAKSLMIDNLTYRFELEQIEGETEWKGKEKQND